MSSKEDILARLRKHAIEPVKRPEMTFEPLAYEHPLEQFEKILQVAGASSVRLEAGQDVNEVIRSLYPEARSIASNLPGITCATVNPDLLEDPRELDGTDVAVIRGEFGVLENGMVWVKQQTRYKAVFFISEALVILLADQFSSSFCKPYFARFRPAQDPQIMYMVDVVNGYRGGRYGFISSHAANTFAVCMFLSLLVRHLYMTCSLVLWAVLCSYSRIYLGVHYPGDILFGALWGILVGVGFYYLYAFLQRRFFQRKEVVSTQYTSSGYAVADLDVFQTVLYFTYLVLAIRAVVI